jgi:hypothetical protein
MGSETSRPLDPISPSQSILGKGFLFPSKENAKLMKILQSEKEYHEKKADIEIHCVPLEFMEEEIRPSFLKLWNGWWSQLVEIRRQRILALLELISSVKDIPIAWKEIAHILADAFGRNFELLSRSSDFSKIEENERQKILAILEVIDPALEISPELQEAIDDLTYLFSQSFILWHLPLPFFFGRSDAVNLRQKQVGEITERRCRALDRIISMLNLPEDMFYVLELCR